MLESYFLAWEPMPWLEIQIDVEKLKALNTNAKKKILLVPYTSLVEQLRIKNRKVCDKAWN